MDACKQKAPRESPARSNAILIVDDDTDTREALAQLLAPLGYIILQAENGRRALKLIARHAHHHFRVILLDLDMPIMDGWTFMDHLSRQAGRVAPKIIVITGQSMRPIAGVSAVLRKPIDVDELLRWVQQF